MGAGLKRRIVLSAVNLVEGGPLAILQDALQVLAHHFADRFEIVALVHRRDLFAIDNVTLLEFPRVKRTWLRRLWFEYRSSLPLSRELDPVLWLSMHDITPRVRAERQAVYCHNPAPFYRTRWWEVRLDPKVAAFSLLYRYLYGFNLHRNRHVVVQQQWMREAFQHRYGASSVVVAHPSVPALEERASSSPSSGASLPFGAYPLSGASPTPGTSGRPWRLFYPCLPRVFKNVQVLLQAAAWLEGNTDLPFEVALTLDPAEHPYTRWLSRHYGHLRSVRWLGRLSRSQVFAQYHAAHAMVFASRLETWGMPLSEFRQTGKPIFAADLPYAHETLAGYAAAHFFPATDGELLGAALLTWMQGRNVLEGAARFTPPQPFTQGWLQLFELLLPPHPETTHRTPA